MKKSASLILIFFLTKFGFSQTEYFHEIEIGTEVLEKEIFALEVNASWKHIYDEIGWRRWGINAMAIKDVKNWTFYGGLTTFYTFNKNIDNFLELRPQVGLGLKTEITDKFFMNQRLLGEWRTFYYSGENEEENYTRTRYRLMLNYIISENEEKATAWKIKPSIEWYFTKNVAIGERFAQSREYTFKLIRGFKNKHELGIGYRLEKFIKFIEENETGHIFLLEYRW